MTGALRMLLLAAAVTISAQLTTAQTRPEQITLTEPGVYELADLFKRADTVALAKVISGDTETYGIPIYKAEVIKSFKGATTGDIVYFGPYVGTRLGWEYILFLRNVPNSLTPKAAAMAGFGMIHYLEIFNEGYTSMEASYECVFDGKDIAQKCDDGVRVCTDYIKLPKSMLTSSSRETADPFGCRWVRKVAFISLLDTLSAARK
jgi:hypothetical protein